MPRLRHAGRQLAFTLTEQAAAAVLEGRVEEARQTFARAHEGTTNLRRCWKRSTTDCAMSWFSDPKTATL